MFSLTTSSPNWKNGNKKTTLRDWSKVCDFIVFWGIDERTFWVIPPSVIAGVAGLHLGAYRQRWTVDQEEIKALVATGITQREAAKRLNVSEQSVSRACNGIGRTSTPRLDPSFDGDKYEDAWDQIISAVGLTNQIEEIDEEFNREFNTPEAVPEFIHNEKE